MSNLISERQRAANIDKYKSRIKVIRGDITRQSDVDAIVSSIPIDMNVDGTLNRNLIAAAGQAFDDFLLENIYKPRVGDVYVVPGFNLPVKNVIYVVTPNFRDGFARDDAYQIRNYRLPMKTATEMRLRKIAFPALGTGHYGYPPERAARLAIRGIMERMSDDFEEVRVVCNKENICRAFEMRLAKYVA